MKHFALFSFLLFSVFLLSGCNAKQAEVVDLNKPLDQQSSAKPNVKDTDTVNSDTTPTTENYIDTELAKEPPVSKSDDMDTLDKELNDTLILNEDFSDL